MMNPENLTKDWVDALENENLSVHDPKTMDTERIHGKPKYCSTEQTTQQQNVNGQINLNKTATNASTRKYEDLFEYKALGI